MSPIAQHCCIIYCNKDNHGPVSVGGAASGGMGFEVVVGSGETGPGGDTGGSVGGEGRKGTEGTGGKGHGGKVRILRQGIL